MHRLLVFLLVPLLWTCRTSEKPESIPVILISIDTLRADRLAFYGSRTVETPALSAFRRDAVLFERAYSHSPLTLPSHATMLTGVLPAQHGVRDNVGFRLGETPDTLATILKRRGYATGAAISAYVLRRETGISRGFDVYDDDVERSSGDKSLGAVQRRGEETTLAATKWIRGNVDRPFFFFLHLYEPHAPYDPPEPFRSRYSQAYDAEVAYSDDIVGKFFQFLKESGLYDRSLIAVVSDHGEGLGDHGEDEHGIFLYREAIAVPMLIKLPANRAGGMAVAASVGLSDLMPTLMHLLDSTFQTKVHGQSLLSSSGELSAPSRPIYSETYYPRFHFGWSDLHSLVEDNEHFIDAPRPELYDLATDPTERKNLIEERRRRYAALRQQLASFKTEAAAPSAVSGEELEKLAALGYIGSTSTTAEKDLPDPKDKTETFRELQEAFRLYRNHEDAKALLAFDRLLKENEAMVDLWDMKSKLLLRMGRPSEAIVAGKEALRRAPTSAHLATDLANQLLLSGELAEAERHAELAIESDPAKAHELLARIALLRGNVAQAEREARLAVDSPGSINAALYTLARIEQKKEDFEGVLRTTTRLLERLEKASSRPLHGVHALRGDALARLGREKEAEGAFRREIEVSRGDLEAYRGLIVLLVSMGRTEEATRAVRDLADASPSASTYRAIAETLRVVGDKDGARYWSARAGRK